MLTELLIYSRFGARNGAPLYPSVTGRGVEGEESDEGLWEWGEFLEIQDICALGIQTPKFIYVIDSILESYPRLNLISANHKEPVMINDCPTTI